MRLKFQIRGAAGEIAYLQVSIMPGAAGFVEWPRVGAGHGGAVRRSKREGEQAVLARGTGDKGTGAALKLWGSWGS